MLLFSKLAEDLVFNNTVTGENTMYQDQPAPSMKDVAEPMTTFAHERAAESDGVLAQALGSYGSSVREHFADIGRNLGREQTRWPGTSVPSRSLRGALGR